MLKPCQQAHPARCCCFQHNYRYLRCPYFSLNGGICSVYTDSSTAIQQRECLFLRGLETWSLRKRDTKEFKKTYE